MARTRAQASSSKDNPQTPKTPTLSEPLEPAPPATAAEPVHPASAAAPGPACTSSRGSVSSKAQSLRAQKLAAEAQHARRTLQLERSVAAERERAAIATAEARERAAEAERERAAAIAEAERERANAVERIQAAERAANEAELRAELAAIDAGSSRASISRVSEWLTNSNECIQLQEVESALPTTPAKAPLRPSASPPSKAPSDAATAGALPELPGASSFHTTHSRYLGTLTQNNCRHHDNKVSEKTSDIQMLAKIITDLTQQPQQQSQKSVSDFKLPIFTGEPTDWLIFRKIYNRTRGRYDSLGNFSRLHLALRGAALDAVAGLLVSTDDPEVVMASLEKQFGRPETIVLQVVAEVRALPRLSSHKGKELNLFACKIRNCVSILRLLDHLEYLACPELINTVLGKLTPMMGEKWVEFAYINRSPSIFKLELLSDFLSYQADIHLRFGPSDAVISHDTSKKGTSKFVKVHHSSTKEADEEDHTEADTEDRSYYNANGNSKKVATKECQTLCEYCQSRQHDIVDCETFLSLSVDDRWQWTIEKKVCRRCLKKGYHRYSSCKNSCKVKLCKYRQHHTLLHKPLLAAPERADAQPVPSLSANSEQAVVVAHSCSSSQQQHTRPLLKVIAVTVSGPKGSVDTFALLDDGSTASLIDEELAEAIGATGPKGTIRVDCVGGLSKESEVSFIDIQVKGRHDKVNYSLKRVRAIPNLNISSQSVKAADIKKLEYLSDIAVELCYDNAKPMLLIGADNWHLTISNSTRSGTRSQPVAVRCALGWVLYGFSCSKTAPVDFVNNAYHIQENSELESLIKEHYKLDSIGIEKKEYHNSNDERALKLLNDTTRRLPSGRFETGLLWKDNIQNVPNSYNLALSRLCNLEKKFQKDKLYAESYKNNINAMINKGYAELCFTPPRASSISWYLPHFGVVHPQKRKLRVVHDAAAACQGVSLNSMLLSGPDLLTPLLAILMRFREGRVALNADIREMFPQVKIREEDRDAQRFLWRDSPNKPIAVYRMSSMIFGATSSPCTALYLKNLNAREHMREFPAATNAIINDHYMDDFLGSFETVDEAAQLAMDVVKVHSQAGFEMRSWISNEKEALSQLPPDFCAANVSQKGLLSVPNKVRILGIFWDVNSDTLSFSNGLRDQSTPLTKRRILSQLMQVYDPLGLLTPVVLKGRILFQQIWRLGIGWDDTLPTNIISKWENWVSELSMVAKGTIPRCYLSQDDPVERQLHVFADSSKYAYACVAYWRISYNDGNVKLALIGGKSRLAPLKPVSIPRLELQAALIAARFANYVVDAHKNKPDKVIFWSDSLTVLKWLRSDAQSFKTFVAHRVGEILETTNVSSWRYVPTSLNIADDATRGQTEFKITSRWFSGPSFLISDPKEWPQEPAHPKIPSAPEELIRNRELIGLTIDRPLQSPSPVVADHSRFSEWRRLLRATARIYNCAKVFRSLLLCKNDQNSKLTDKKEEVRSSLSALSAEEISKAERNLLISSQLTSFKEEIDCIKNSKPLQKQSRLKNLTLIVDSENLLRLSSRIISVKNVPATQDVRPVVLDGRNRVVQLLIASYHKKFSHGSNETVVNELRQKYHILHLRPSVKSIATRCQFCRIRKTVTQIPLMGDLPEGRLAHHVRPFSHVGVDYFGPVNITAGRKRLKRYVALFTCMTIRAVHLEIVDSLTSDSALMAIRRFIARRGCPSDIYSDNGTAFVGAARQIKEMYDFAANNQINWHFIPPAAPFMGGCWERLVRSIKTSLNITLKERAPKEEVFNTLLLEAEAVVNSRPLTHVSINPEDEEAITPFHFILGTSSNDRPLVPLIDADLYSRQEWKKGLRLADHFWQRWTREVLPCLAPRPAAGNSSVPLRCGDLVLVVDGSLPRGSWPRGRVSKIYPGKDGIVRVVEVATKGGILKRATRLLIPLASDQP